jgi:hypothetical protein
MMIELQVRWIDMQMPDEDAAEAYIKKLVHGEQAKKPKFVYDYAPMSFDIEDVKRFNRANDAGCTVLRFKDGDSCVVKMSYEHFQALWSDQTGKTIYIIEHLDQPEQSENGSDDIDI